MSYYQQRNRNRLSIGQDGNALTMLLAINLVVFVMLAFIKVVYYFGSAEEGKILFDKNIFSWITLPADTDVFLTRPWTLLTHMFVHDTKDIWHILGNMLWLCAFGYIFQDLTGNRKLIPIFIYGALAGAAIYMLCFNIFEPLRQQLPGVRAFGASAGVMAIAIGTTALSPGYRIFPMLNGGIPLWVVTVLFLIIDLATIPENNPGGHIAHIAGGGMGFLFVLMLQRGRDWSLWMNDLYDWFDHLFDPDRPKKGKVVKTQLFYKSKGQPYTKTPIVTQQKVDEILDKIGQKGYGSLTEDEKEILRRASKEDI